MAKDNSKDLLQPQQIPLAKNHNLPGVFVGKQPNKSYGGLVTSIQASGMKENIPIILPAFYARDPNLWTILGFHSAECPKTTLCYRVVWTCILRPV